MNNKNSRGNGSARIPVAEICQRLGLGERAVYALLDAKIIPALRFRNRWIIGRHAYEEWEQEIGKGSYDGYTLRNTNALQ